MNESNSEEFSMLLSDFIARNQPKNSHRPPKRARASTSDVEDDGLVDQRPVSKARRGGRGISIWEPFVTPSVNGKYACIMEYCGTKLTIDAIGKHGKRLKLWNSVKLHFKSHHPAQYSQIVSKKDEQQNQEECGSQDTAISHAVTKLTQRQISSRRIDLGLDEKSLFYASYSHAQAVCGFPKSMSQAPAYRRVFASFCCDILPPCPATINKHQKLMSDFIKRKQNDEFASIISEYHNMFNEIQSFPIVSGQYDLYRTSLNEKQEVIGGYIQIINPETLSNFRICLGIHQIDESTTGYNICNFFHDMLVRNEVIRKEENIIMNKFIFSVTTDTANNMTNSVTSQMGAIHFSCMNHRLHLAVVDAIDWKSSGLRLSEFPDANEILDKIMNSEESIEEILRDKTNGNNRSAPAFQVALCKMSALGAHFSRSAKSASEFRAAQTNACGETTVPCLWNKTRWSGMYSALLSHYTCIENGLIKFIQDQERNFNQKLFDAIKINDQHSIIITDLMSILAPVNELTLFLQSDGRSVGECYIEVMFCCLDLLNDTIVNPINSVAKEVYNLHASVAEFRKRLFKSICERIINPVSDEIIFSIFTSRLLISKMEYICSKVASNKGLFESFWDGLFGTCLPDKESAVDIFNCFKMRFISIAKNRIASLVKLASVSASANVAESNHLRFKDRMCMTTKSEYELFLIQKKSMSMASATTMTPEEEATLFTEAILAIDANTPERVFWVRNKLRFKRIFLEYLKTRAMAASSSNTESLFSLTSRSVTDDRTNLDIETLTNMIKIKSYDANDDFLKSYAKQYAMNTSSSSTLNI